MILHSPRIKVATLGELIPQRFRDTLEQNQLIAHCCRHPENHEIEAFRSKEEERAPDIYVFHCTCGKRHIRLVGGGGIRPMWEVR
jgi:hypothetical protein